MVYEEIAARSSRVPALGDAVPAGRLLDLRKRP